MTTAVAGMAHMAGLIEGGMSHRDAVAQVAQWKMGRDLADWLGRYHSVSPNRLLLIQVCVSACVFG